MTRDLCPEGLPGIPPPESSGTLRRSPRFHMVQYSALSPSDRRIIGEYEQGSGVSFIVPIAEGRVKAIDEEAAAFLLAVGERTISVSEALEHLEGDERALWCLILDDVLEWETAAGAYVSGSSAWSKLPRADWQVASDTVDSLSYRALETAIGLGNTSDHAITAALYGFNRLPYTAQSCAMLHDSRVLDGYLGVTSPMFLQRIARQGWLPEQQEGPWHFWSRRPDGPGSDALTFKLYVSPHIDTLPDALKFALQVGSEYDAVGCKVGRDIRNLLRPDKLILYFTGSSALVSAGEELGGHLAGCRAQRTPFTRDISESGLVSAGMDPPSDRCLPLSRRRESWRLWVVQTLAIALAQAVTEGLAPHSASEYALSRIALEGVYPGTWAWTPTLERIWRNG